MNLVHFICFIEPYQMEEKSNVFIDNYFDKNERTRQESVKNPQIKHHNVKF